MNGSKLAMMMGLAAAIGADYGPQANNDERPYRHRPEPNPFQTFHNEMRQLCKRSLPNSRKPRPHIGKKATRATKRAKVAAMKEAGHFRGDNRELVYE